MKHWFGLSLIVCAALTIFGAGLTLGQLGWSPQVAIAAPSDDPTDSSGGEGGFFTWQQTDQQLKISVGGPDAAYIGFASLTDPNAWLELGDSELLQTPETVELDLTSVEAMTFYRMVPIAQFEDGVFLPCAELPAGCFPIRPPLPNPYIQAILPGVDPVDPIP